MYDSKPDWTPIVKDGVEYWGFPNRAAEFYLDNMLLPVTPHTWKVNNNNTNESDQLVDGDPITIPKRDKAQSFSMDFIFLHDQRFFRNRYSTFLTQKYEENESGEALTLFEVKDLTDYLWEKKSNRDPIVITIIYPFQENLNLRAILDDYSYTQSAENASDYEFSLTFTEYHAPLNQEVDIELQNTLVRHNIRALRHIGGPMPSTPITYETVTGKHEMTWEEMRNQIEEWLKGEWDKISEEDYTNFDDIFRKWWESDEERKQLHCPDTNLELKNWWIDFMQQSDIEQTNKQKWADIEAWLDAEVKKITDDPPEEFWTKFRLWWRSNPTLENNLHRPINEEELFNWWDDFQKQSENEQKFEDVKAWLNAELRKITKNPPEDFWEGLQFWWAYDPERETMHCPTTEEELLNWWDDFMELTDDDNQTLADIHHWLNEELKKITKNPPTTFKEKFKLWWESDETRKNNPDLHMPDTDHELVLWWKDYLAKAEEEEYNQQKLGEIWHWLNAELANLVLDTPDDFWECFRIWWLSDEERRNSEVMHMPDDLGELFTWWDDFQRLNAEEEKIKELEEWLDGELKNITDRPPETFKEKFELWWKNDPERAEKDIPQSQTEIVDWWDVYKQQQEADKEESEEEGDS